MPKKSSSTIRVVTSTLLRGDPFETSDDDTIAQIGMIDVGEKIPFGWNILSGNEHYSEIGRVALRYEIEQEA
jgi:hypothetical protein